MASPNNPGNNNDAGAQSQGVSSRLERLTTAEKRSAVMRVLGGASIEVVSEEVGVSIRRLERWRNDFVEAGSAALARRKDVRSNNWFTRNAGSISQWLWLLLALLAVTGMLAYFLQRSTGE